jgi:very-short-patch-repair endonuclease
MGLRLLTDRAHQARRHNAEHRLSWLLRSRRLRGYRFRRQHAVGPFIVDFICVEEALIVELMGDQHVAGFPADTQRKLFLESLGFRVLRLWDSEVLSDPKAALAKLLECVKSRAH